MADTGQTEYRPDIITPTGETLAEVLEERGMTQAKLAERTGLARKTVNEIVKGKNALTPDTALQLERVLGVPASFWNNREQAFRDYLARKAERVRLAEQVEWLKEIPVRAMINNGWIREVKDKVGQLREVLNYFGVTEVEQWRGSYEAPQGAFRKSRAFESDPGVLAAWLRKGELEAHVIRTADYDANQFRAVLHEVRKLTRESPEKSVPRLQELCASAGVALVLVQELPKTRANGVTRWLCPKKALIQLSLYGRWADIFWFTFFHEAGHILKHGKREVFLEAKSGKVEGTLEEEVDRFATDSLIPRSEYRDFAARTHFSKRAITTFARRLGIAPGIVVGRLQHEKLLPHTHCNDLRKRYQWGEAF